MKAQLTIAFRCDAYGEGAHITIAADTALPFLPAKGMNMLVEGCDRKVVDFTYDVHEAILWVELEGYDYDTPERVRYQSIECWVGSNESGYLQWYVWDYHKINPTAD